MPAIVKITFELKGLHLFRAFSERKKYFYIVY